MTAGVKSNVANSIKKCTAVKQHEAIGLPHIPVHAASYASWDGNRKTKHVGQLLKMSTALNESV